MAFSFVENAFPELRLTVQQHAKEMTTEPWAKVPAWLKVQLNAALKATMLCHALYLDHMKINTQRAYTNKV